MTTTRIAVLALALAGCGGKASSSEPLEASRDQQPHAAGRPAGEAHADGDAHEPPAGAVGQFHDVLAPRWHAAKGPQRMTDTCTALPQLHDGATAIAATAAPDGADPAAWKAGAGELAAAVDALDATCGAKDAAAFEPAFERVHTSFHRVMEAGAKHP